MKENYKNNHRLMKILLSPIISEKATLLSNKNNYIAFKVISDASKKEIKSAVELLFNVGVKSVNVLISKGKIKRSSRSIGRRKDIKKAYVRLMPGKEINFEVEAR